MDRDTKIQLESQERILPKFARTFHLPLEPNASRDDLIAPESRLAILKDPTLVIEEKVDGANVGITVYKGTTHRKKP